MLFMRQSSQRTDLEKYTLITQETNGGKVLMQLHPGLNSLHLQLCVASQEEVNILYENTLFFERHCQPIHRTDLSHFEGRGEVPARRHDTTALCYHANHHWEGK